MLVRFLKDCLPYAAGETARLASDIVPKLEKKGIVRRVVDPVVEAPVEEVPVEAPAAEVQGEAPKEVVLPKQGKRR